MIVHLRPDFLPFHRGRLPQVHAFVNANHQIPLVADLPILEAVSEGAEAGFGVPGERVRTAALGPAVVFFDQLPRQVEVIERHKRADSLFQKASNHSPANSGISLDRRRFNSFRSASAGLRGIRIWEVGYKKHVPPLFGLMPLPPNVFQQSGLAKLTASVDVERVPINTKRLLRGHTAIEHLRGHVSGGVHPPGGERSRELIEVARYGSRPEIMV